MVMVPSFIKIMEEYMKVNGLKIKCMEWEHYFMLLVNLPMKDNGLMISLKVKELCINTLTFISLYNEEPQSLFTEFDYRDFDQVGEFWTKYVGLFHDDNKEGQGTLYLSNGDKFEGNFLQDLVSGPGKYIKSNGQFVSGRWWRNKLYSNIISFQLDIFEIPRFYISILYMFSKQSITIGVILNPLLHFDYLSLIINFLIQPHFQNNYLFILQSYSQKLLILCCNNDNQSQYIYIIINIHLHPKQLTIQIYILLQYIYQINMSISILSIFKVNKLHIKYKR